MTIKKILLAIAIRPNLAAPTAPEQGIVEIELGGGDLAK